MRLVWITESAPAINHRLIQRGRLDRMAFIVDLFFQR